MATTSQRMQMAQVWAECVCECQTPDAHDCASCNARFLLEQLSKTTVTRTVNALPTEDRMARANKLMGRRINVKGCLYDVVGYKLSRSKNPIDLVRYYDGIKMRGPIELCERNLVEVA